MADWKIRRRHGECTQCQAEFVDGDRHASSLRVDEEQDLLREDLCPKCFGSNKPDSYLFWWFTRFYEKRSKSIQLDLASLERLFMELGGREEEKLRELRYLLCLLLMRKRRLKLQKVKRGKQGEELILRRPRRTEELSVWVYDFTPDRIEELRTRLQEVLEGSGPAESAEGEEPNPDTEAEAQLEPTEELEGDAQNEPQEAEALEAEEALADPQA
ncbi:MAG: hypothetical protein ACI8X5_002920 [Planctomycetota bacterium]|jgi:hypothetical protein